jgi:hypothetical protein
MDDAARAARRMWTLFEPVHVMTYGLRHRAAVPRSGRGARAAGRRGVGVTS